MREETKQAYEILIARPERKWTRKREVVETLKSAGVSRASAYRHVDALLAAGLLSRSGREWNLFDASATRSYEEDWSAFCHWLAITEKAHTSAPPARRRSLHRVLVISDLHVPFHNQEAITEAVASVGDDIDTLVIGGDFLDLYSLSRFTQYEKIPIREELRAARILLEWLRGLFPRIVILSGNHEERERKHFHAKLTPDEAEWLLERPILERLASDLDNVEVVKQTIQGTEVRWFYAIGDALIGHPEAYSSIPLRAVDKFRQWISLWHNAVGLGMPRLIVIGHTHQAGIAWIGDTIIVENGCLCKIQGYALQPRLGYRPQRLACTRFDLQDDRVLVNSVRQYYPKTNPRTRP